MYKLTIEFISDYIDNKLQENEKYIVCTFYDLRVKNNLSEADVNTFLQLARTRLENMDYLVYFTGGKYKYNGKDMIVKDNEYLVAIKGGEPK